MSFSSIKKKELTLQETFYNLCKDLIRYIDRKIVKKYISPNQAQVPKEKRKEKKYNDNIWRYFYEDEETTEEERIRDIFKENTFLLNLQKLYNSLNIIVNNMEENKKNIELLNKKLEFENQQLKIYGELQTELAKYLIDNNCNINNLSQNDLIKEFNNIINNNIIKNINPEMIKQFLFTNSMNNNFNFNQNNINNNNEQNINNNNSLNNNKINNNEENIDKENNINLSEKKENKQNQNKNNLYKNKSIPTLIQALESINKSKNSQKNNKTFHKNKILDSDSSDSDEEENDEEEEENTDKNKKFINYETKKNILNKKTKRKNNK